MSHPLLLVQRARLATESLATEPPDNLTASQRAAWTDGYNAGAPHTTEEEKIWLGGFAFLLFLMGLGVGAGVGTVMGTATGKKVG